MYKPPDILTTVTNKTQEEINSYLNGVLAGFLVCIAIANSHAQAISLDAEETKTVPHPCVALTLLAAQVSSEYAKTVSDLELLEKEGIPALQFSLEEQFSKNTIPINAKRAGEVVLN